MTKEEIVKRLKENHSALTDYVNSLSKEDFEYAFENKWSAGQQVDHIYKSVKPLYQIFHFPKFLIKYKFGKANRPSKTYEGLVDKYLSKIGTDGGTAPSKFKPSTIKIATRQANSLQLNTIVAKLCNQVTHFSEKDLDILILPHPLMGRVTVREMLFFTIYHAQHHHQLIKKYLENRNSND